MSYTKYRMEKMPKDMTPEELDDLPVKILLSMDSDELLDDGWVKREFEDSDGKTWLIGKDKEGWFKATGMCVPGS